MGYSQGSGLPRLLRTMEGERWAGRNPKEMLRNLDRRVVYVFVFLGVAIPMFIPFRFPIEVTDEVSAVYDTIEDIAAKGGGTNISDTLASDLATASSTES